jgi:omega-3 fatty acid desaturase (delta-15 desaturase)
LWQRVVHHSFTLQIVLLRHSYPMASTNPVEFPTLSEIKRSIPSSCFESDTRLSLYYTARALFHAWGLAAALFALRMTSIVHEYIVLDALLCSSYIYVQGVVFWGFFTIGHDCGHSSFSRYHSLNFIVGNLMHSAILTPFESWRITHRHHHKNTGNIDQDEIFYPQRASSQYKRARLLV